MLWKGEGQAPSPDLHLSQKSSFQNPSLLAQSLLLQVVKDNGPIAEQHLDVKIKREAFTENRIVVVRIVFRNSGPLLDSTRIKKQFSKSVAACGKTL